MHTGWVRRLLVGAAVGTVGLIFALPGTALAGGGGGASGSVEPKVVERGDDASFFIECGSKSSTASLTGTPLGLPSNIAMVKLTSREFDLDVTIPSRASRGTHHISMQCSDGSFTEVTLVVSPHGGADTGDGAMSGGTSAVALAAGGVLVVGAGVGGVLLMRRRRVHPAR
ncbi:MAG TPA: hypothetical protein VGF84_12775 [Micromonosporaceae bacterium]